MVPQAGNQLDERHRDAVDRGRHAALERHLDIRPARRDIPLPSWSACTGLRAARRQGSSIRRAVDRSAAEVRVRRHRTWPRVGPRQRDHIAAPALTARMRRVQRGAARRVGRAAAVGDGVGLLDAGNVDELPRDERPPSAASHRIAILVQRVGLERRQDVVARELFADVEHVRARGAGASARSRTASSSRALPEIERHGDHLGAVALPAARESPTEVSRPPEYASTMRRSSVRPACTSSRRFTSAAAPARRRAR